MSQRQIFLTEDVAWERLDCIACGAEFWLMQERVRRLRETGMNFWCPNGHLLHFDPPPPKRKVEVTVHVPDQAFATQQQTIEKLRSGLERLMEERDQLAREASAAAAQAAKWKYRAAKTPCQLCGKAVKIRGMRTHVRLAHPDYQETTHANGSEPLPEGLGESAGADQGKSEGSL